MMFSHRGLRAWILGSFFISCVSIAGPLSQQEEINLTSSQWKMPSELSLERIENLLSLFCEQTKGVAFRTIGVEEDFFHGHVLFEKKEHAGRVALFPRAILYHTQEEAHKAHWEKSIDLQFDYINITTRNWIQWLDDDPAQDGMAIENARLYLDEKQKDPTPFFDEKAEPQKNHHYTIHAKNLDSLKTGFVLAGELQFEFYQDMNSSLGFGPQKSIKLENCGDHKALQLFTNTLYLDRS